jgi:hypothetical protein
MEGHHDILLVEEEGKEMREIKFRAWDKQAKKMYYDVERCYDTLSWYGGNTELSVTSFGEVLECKIPDENWEDGPEHRFEVMQYTGWEDSYDKKIYEEDILMSDNKPLCTVTWNQEYGCWDLGGTEFCRMKNPRVGGNSYEIMETKK